MVDWAVHEARALLEAGAAAADVARFAPLDLARRRALAWAVKDKCLAAWTADPPGTRRCAEVLERLNALQPDRELAALAAWAAGIAALAEGCVADALPLLERAHVALAAGGHRRAAAETLVPKVMALAMLGRHAEALACGEHARALLVDHGDGHAAGRVELNLGTLLFRVDRHAEAARMYRSAAVHFARARDAARSILADIGLAHALTWQFDFDEALRINRRALRRAEQRSLVVPQAQARLAIGRIELLRGRYHPALTELARSLALLDEAQAAPQQRLEAAGALADAYLAVNLLPEAHDLYDQVIDAALSLGAPTEEARARVERARVRGRLGHHDAALADLARALSLFGAAGNAAAAADVELASGQIQLALGNAAAAARHATAAAAALRDSGVVGWQLDAQILAAAAAARLGQMSAASAGLRAALELADSLRLLPQQVAARVGRGELDLEAGRIGEARETLGRALDLVEGTRAELADDEFRSAIAALGERAHGLLVQATAKAVASNDAEPSELFDVIERGRARALALGLAAVAQAAPTDAVEELRSQFLRRRWRELIAAGAEGDRERHAAELRRLEGQWLEVQRRQRLRRRDEPRAAAAAGAELAPAAAVQRDLHDGEALVAFHLDGDELRACVLTRDACHTESWRAPGLIEAIEGLRFQIETPRYQTALLHAHAELLAARVRRRAQALHALVLAPLGSGLEGRSRIVFVPHGVLHYVPWCALHDGNRWLVEQVELSLAASATAWLAARARPWQPPARVLALGAAAESLPHVRLELEAIGHIFGARAQLLMGPQARADTLLSKAADADVLHLACHGRFRADNPAFSSLTLAEAPLTLHELRTLRLKAELVVLSACETAQSRIAAGDELIGLVRGFTLAGASAVLATQWAVSDSSTADLMADLYRELAAGRGPAAALRAAQRAAIAGGAHPFQWAALALYGRG